MSFRLLLPGLALLVALPTLAEDAPDADAAAWSDFCRRLEAAGHQSLAAGAARTPEDRAAGLRYLAEQVAAAVEREVVARELAFPLFRVGSNQLKRWGMDGADAKYQLARVDGEGRYRISGRTGSARLVAFQLFRSEPRYEAFASLSGDALEVGADGEFELMLSANRPAGFAGNWLALDPRATDLLVREYFGDWAREGPGEFRIERLDEVAPTPPLTPDEAAALLTRIAESFATRAPMWTPRNEALRTQLRNRVGPPLAAEGQGLANNVYGAGWFDLAPDEALVVELEPPEARLWSFQLGNLWWESSEYVTRSGSLNGDQAFVSGDGRVRIVIALEDPGVPNWLDPGGHREGQILYRYQDAQSVPLPSARLVKRSELAGVLPADTPKRGSEARSAERALRSAHAALRWAP